MTILVLDPRWPDMLPIAIAQQLSGELTYTAEVPISVRWALNSTEGPGTWLITTDEDDQQVQERISKGEKVLRVTSLQDPIYQAQRTMHNARRRGQWEQSMTHETLLPYLAEESAELAQAIREHATDEELKKELSDVLLQVLFHAEIAKERGAFGFAEVAQAFVDKMKARAPYLFDGSQGPINTDEQDRLWQEAKAKGN